MDTWVSLVGDQCRDYVHSIVETYREREQFIENCTQNQSPETAAAREQGLQELAALCRLRSYHADVAFKSANIVDRLCSLGSLGPQLCKLAVVTAAHITAKCSEIKAPALVTLMRELKSEFSTEQVRICELRILKVLDFDVDRPTPYSFVDVFAAASGCSDHVRSVCFYLVNITLTSKLPRMPSMIAASAVYMARRMTRSKPYWPEAIQRISRYSETELASCSREINALADSNREKETFAYKCAKYVFPSLKTIKQC